MCIQYIKMQFMISVTKLSGVELVGVEFLYAIVISLKQCFNFKVTAMMTTKKISPEHTQKEMRRVSKSVSTHPHTHTINETQRKTVEKRGGTKSCKRYRKQ